MHRTSRIDTSGIIALIGLLCAGIHSPGHAQTEAARLQPADLIYRGAFAVQGDAWAYGGHALTYYPNGDATGPSDGYPGSLFMAGNATQGLVGEIAIPSPVISDDFTALPSASILTAPADITEGWMDNCTFDPECIYRVVSGLAYLSNIDRIAWNLNDWYNTAGYDQDSLGWSDTDLTGAAGVWHIGPRENSIFHNAKTAGYLFNAPSDFAADHLSNRTLIAGNQREAGAFGGSQGPTLFALAPWQDGDPPAAGQNLEAQALLYYREHYTCVWLGEERINPTPAEGVCDLSGYRAADAWSGGSWVEAGERTAVLLFGTKALGDNCYDSAEACGNDPCRESRGYHAYPYQAQVLLYDPEELVASIGGTRDPWTIQPYATIDASPYVLGDANCNGLGDAAYDRERQRLYVAEQVAGPEGETVVHVWDLATRPARDHLWQVAEIYIATMGYAPDDEGLQYWVDELTAGTGWTATSVAQSFFDQPLVQIAYPDALENDPLVTALYQNIFGRDPDETGRAYWLAELEEGRAQRDQMIIRLINGGWANIEAAEDMERFSNRVEVALEFAAYQAAHEILYNALTAEDQVVLREAGAEVLSGVTADTATRDAAIAEIPSLLASLVED